MILHYLEGYNKQLGYDSCFILSRSRGITEGADSEIWYCTSIQHSPNFLLILTSWLLGEVYYLLYIDDYEKPLKAAFNPEEHSLGHIWADYVMPPHSLATIKLFISRVEGIPALAHTDIFADISCNTPLKEGPISNLGTGCPGLSPKKPMGIVQRGIVWYPSIPLDGRYFIKNYSRAHRDDNYFLEVGSCWLFLSTTLKVVGDSSSSIWQVNEHSPIIQMFRG